MTERPTSQKANPSTKQSPLQKLSQQANAYSAAAATLMATGASMQAQAGVVYTDVDPDQTISDANYAVDFNGDGLVDITVQHRAYSFGSGSYLSAFRYAELSLPPGNGVLVMGAFFPPAAALSSGDFIGPTGTFSDVFPRMAAWYQYISGGSSSLYIDGPWVGLSDRYLGVEFLISGSVHYGWIRMDVSSDLTSVTIKDFAYEDVAGVPIQAGNAALSAETASALLASDIGDVGNGEDLELAFDNASPETTVSEYRMIAVKSASLPFDLAAAEALPATSYVAVAPTGSPIANTFGVFVLDSDGDAIAPGVPYTCFVLSMPDGTDATLAALSDPSNEVTLLANASPADNVTATDIGNNGNGADMAVGFTRATDESTVLEYRILVVDSADAPLFDAAAASAVPAGNYTAVPKTGSDLSTLLSVSATTVNGDLLANNVPYVVFVLSVADGTIAQTDVLSPSSAAITLRNISGLAPGFAEGGPKAWTAEGRLFWTSDHGGEYRFIGLDGRVIDQGQYASGEGQMPLPQAHQGIVELTEDGQRYALRWSH